MSGGTNRIKERPMEDDNRLPYFFLGLGLGVAAGVLFAPKSGKETRDYLRDRAEEGADVVKRKSGELRDQAGDMLDRGKQQLQRHKDNLSAAVEAGRSAYRDSVTSPQPE